MGIEGAVGFLKREGASFGTPISLRSGLFKHLVIDCTKGLDKLVLKNIVVREPHFAQLGYSMVGYGTFVRDLLKNLLNNNIQPLFVFNGGRKSEQLFGPNVSGAEHFRYSCGAALRDMQTRFMDRSFDLPELATNVLKEVICELGLQENMYQATYEVYPTLLHLANQFNCPVMTGHSDFVFQPALAGFFWFDDLYLPADPQQPISATLYEHFRLLQTYQLNPRHCSSLCAFTTLLRPDFHRNYFAALNRLFRLENGNLTMTNNTRDRKLTQRLRKIMADMFKNDHLNSIEDVRSTLTQYQRESHSWSLMLDFENILETYTVHFPDFATTEFGQLLNRGANGSISPSSSSSGAQVSRVQPAELKRALTRRLSTAEFHFNLANTTYFRTRVEDCSLTRSTFSLQDVGRQYLLDNAMPPTNVRLTLYDRCYTLMLDRHLNRRPGERQRLTKERLLELFHISTKELDSSTKLLIDMDIDAENARELALFLLLTRFGVRLLQRRDYNNQPPVADQSARSSGSQGTVSLGSQTGQLSSQTRPLKSYDELRRDFYEALLNSFVYYCSESQGDQSSRDVPANIRVARNKMSTDIVATRDPSILSHNNFAQYIKLKHMNEALNSVLHIYIEMNSLYDFPAPKLHVSKHHDGVLIYKIMSRMSNNLRGYLLNLGPALCQILDLGPSSRDGQS